MTPHCVKSQKSENGIASGCDGKQAFESAKLALGVAKRGRCNQSNRAAYRCATCRLWHIGTSLASKSFRKHQRAHHAEEE